MNNLLEKSEHVQLAKNLTFLESGRLISHIIYFMLICNSIHKHIPEYSVGGGYKMNYIFNA